MHHFVSEPHLLRRGLTNYWGYNTVGFFAPHAAYSSAGTRGEQVREFKAMVRALHAAGIEVLLDVVYNHSGEGDVAGPTLAFRGLDNRSWYRLDPGDRSRYRDTTGCGNTLDLRSAHALQLVTDSLRYWVQEMHVDGFRFDLTPALARGSDDFDPRATFLQVLQQDPVLSDVKLIAEPWDVGPGGYQVGRFPPPWAEWNDQYRDTVRDAWRGHGGGLRSLAYRLSGSSDLFFAQGRQPWASVNFVTAHDGFSLHDLTAYDRKHNEANGEDGRDGSSENRSWNCGVEGETDDAGGAGAAAAAGPQPAHDAAAVVRRADADDGRRGPPHAVGQQQRLLPGLAAVVAAVGPRARTPSTCKAFTAELVRLRREHPVFRQASFFLGRPGVDGVKDVAWFTPRGRRAHRRRLVRRRAVHARHVPRRPRHPRARPARRAGRRRQLPARAAPRRRPTSASACPTAPYASSYDVLLDTCAERPAPDPSRVGVLAGTELARAGRSAVLLRANR